MGALKSLPDSELVKLLSDGDVAAVAEIYMRYAKGLLYHASKLLGDEASAKDLVHDLFAHLIDRMESLNINGPLEAYLYKSVRNRVINIFHKDKNRQKYVDGIKDHLEKGEPVTEDTVLVNEMIRRINTAVAEFPEKMRVVYDLSRMEDMSRKEIAEATGNTETNVNYYINKARNILRTKLSCWFFF